MRLTRLLIYAICLASALSLAAQQESSVADAAKKKPAKRAARVITDDDLPSRASQPESSGTSGSSAAQAAASDAKSSESSDAKPAKDAKDAKGSDTADVEALRARVKELDSDEANLVQGIDKLRDDADKEEDSSRREVLLNMLNRRQISLERARAERALIMSQINSNKKNAK